MSGDPGLGARLQLALRGGRDLRLQPGPGGGRHALPLLRLPRHPRLEVWHTAPQGDKVGTAHLHRVQLSYGTISCMKMGRGERCISGRLLHLMLVCYIKIGHVSMLVLF